MGELSEPLLADRTARWNPLCLLVILTARSGIRRDY